MTTRDEVVAALADVPDVTAYLWRPTAPRPGDAFPLHQGFVRDDRSGQFFAEWRLVIVLTQDDRAASQWVDAHVDALVDTLAPTGYITSIRPVQMTVADSPGGMLALEVIMRSG